MKSEFEVLKQFGTLSESKNGWKKELNLVIWNDGDPKYDIRTWDPYGKPTKGITLNLEELRELHKAIGKVLARVDVEGGKA